MPGFLFAQVVNIICKTAILFIPGANQPAGGRKQDIDEHPVIQSGKRLKQAKNSLLDDLRIFMDFVDARRSAYCKQNSKKAPHYGIVVCKMKIYVSDFDYIGSEFSYNNYIQLQTIPFFLIFNWRLPILQNKIVKIISILSLLLASVTAYFTYQKAAQLNQVTIYRENTVEQHTEEIPAASELALTSDGKEFSAVDGSRVFIDGFGVPVSGTIAYDGDSLAFGDLIIFTQPEKGSTVVKEYAAQDGGTVTLGSISNGEKTLYIRKDAADEEKTITSVIQKVIPSDKMTVYVNTYCLSFDHIVINTSAIYLTKGEKEVYIYPFGGKVETLTLDEETGIYSGKYTDKTTGLSAFVIDNLEILADSEDTLKEVLGL